MRTASYSWRYCLKITHYPLDQNAVYKGKSQFCQNWLNLQYQLGMIFECVSSPRYIRKVWFRRILFSPVLLVKLVHEGNSFAKYVYMHRRKKYKLRIHWNCIRNQTSILCKTTKFHIINDEWTAHAPQQEVGCLHERYYTGFPTFPGHWSFYTHPYSCMRWLSTRTCF